MNRKESARKRKLCLSLLCMLLIGLTACSNPANEQLSNTMVKQPKTNTSPGTTSAVGNITQADISQMDDFKMIDSKIDNSRMVESMVNIQITVGDKTFSGKLYNNETTQELMKQMPLKVTMDELNGNEKFYYFKEGLPTDSYNPADIQAGDLMLFGSDCLVLFYESFSTSYSYTRLGTVEDSVNLAQALGDGSAEVTFRLQNENSQVNAK